MLPHRAIWWMKRKLRHLTEHFPLRRSRNFRGNYLNKAEEKVVINQELLSQIHHWLLTVERIEQKRYAKAYRFCSWERSGVCFYGNADYGCNIRFRYRSFLVIDK